ncbi:MAG: FeoB-associated Cys-rich membrane protein [Clostridiales bacterium]|nr:FeoB-associated Cys-rich membrane protein [Clostridiales bacterium]
MLDFFLQNTGTIAVGLLLAAAVCLAIYRIRQNRKKGRSACGCGCGCRDCPSVNKCHKK